MQRMNTTQRPGPFTSRTRRRPRGTAPLLLVAAAAWLLAACGSDKDASEAARVGEPAAATIVAAADMASAPAMEAPAATDAAAVAEGASTASDAPVGEVQAAAPLDVPVGESPVFVGRDIIFTGTLTLTTPDIKRAVEQITQIVSDAGGGVFASNVVLGEGGHGTMTVKLPPRAINATINALGAIGEVSGFTQDAQDVTSQMVDLDARILTAAASVDRAREFLNQATNISDLAQLENELTNRETALEQLRAQQRSLGDQVSSATLTIELVMPVAAPIVELEAPRIPSNFVKIKQSTVGEAFSDGLGAFVTAAKFVAVVVAILAPFLVTLALIVLPIRMFFKIRSRRRRTAAMASPPPAPISTPISEPVSEPVSV